MNAGSILEQLTNLSMRSSLLAKDVERLCEMVREVAPAGTKTAEQALFERNQLAQLVARMAEYLGWTATWVPSDPDHVGWPRLVVNLPTGQITCRIPQDEAVLPLRYRSIALDECTDQEKYARIESFVREGFSARRSE